MRIVCEQLVPDHWLAWIEGRTESASTGESAAQAIEQLVETLPGVESESLTIIKRASRMGRYVFAVDAACPDCKGTGQYVGLVAVENCRMCEGLGRVDDDGGSRHVNMDEMPF